MNNIILRLIVLVVAIGGCFACEASDDGVVESKRNPYSSNYEKLLNLRYYLGVYANKNGGSFPSELSELKSIIGEPKYNYISKGFDPDENIFFDWNYLPNSNKAPSPNTILITSIELHGPMPNIATPLVEPSGPIKSFRIVLIFGNKDVEPTSILKGIETYIRVIEEREFENYLKAQD